MNFETALTHLLRWEGGLVNNPKDPGGLTKYGISLRAYPDLGEAGIRALTPQSAGVIYKRDYWDAMHCDELPDKLRLMALDCAVNQGVSFATRALQSSIGVTADGKIGPGTIAAASRADVRQTVEKFSVNRCNRYMKHPQWVTFREGWMRRLINVTLTTLE